MKKVLWLVVCLMTIVLNVNAHNVHYPTCTVDGITYVKAGVSDDIIDGNWYERWDILKINKHYDKTIVLPNMVFINGKKVKVNNIREEAFSECYCIDSLIVTDGLYLNYDAFRNCKKLEYIYYSSTTCGWSPSYPNWYPNLSCKILETTSGVYEDTFWYSIRNSLEKIIIRNDSKGVFESVYNCQNLKTIICYAVNPPNASNTRSVYSYGGTCGHEKFTSSQWAKITMYVPRESLEKYYFHSVWGEIDNIYPIDEMRIHEMALPVNSITADKNEDDIWFSIDGKKVDKPNKGIYIKNGKKYIIK